MILTYAWVALNWFKLAEMLQAKYSYQVVSSSDSCTVNVPSGNQSILLQLGCKVKVTLTMTETRTKTKAEWFAVKMNGIVVMRASRMT